MPAKDILSSQVVVRGKAQPNSDVVSTFSSSDVYLPTTQVTATPETPVTVNPIAVSPTERAAVSYSTDDMDGVDIMTYLFANNNTIGKQISNTTSLSFITGASDSVTVSVGDTYIIDGITATATTTSISLADLFADFEARFNDPTAVGANFTMSGTASGTWNWYFGYPASGVAYILIVPVDALSSATPPSKTGTGTGVTSYTTTGNGTQKNVPSYAAFLNAGAVGITYNTSLGIDDTTEAIFLAAKDFHNAEAVYQQKSVSELNAVKKAITGLKRLNLGDGDASVTDLETAVNALLKRAKQQSTSSYFLYQKAGNAILDLKSDIKTGDYLEATTNLKLAAGDMDGNGFIRITKSLTAGKSITLLGRTLTNNTAGTITTVQIATVLAGGTITNIDMTGTITSGYSFAARNASNEVAIIKSSGVDAWDVTVTSTQTNYSYVIVYPLETVFETSTARADVTSLVAALNNTNDAAANAFSSWRNIISTSWASAKQYLQLADTKYTQAISGVLSDLSDLSTDTTYTPNKFVFSYDSIELDDTGLASLVNASVEYIRHNEIGSQKKVTTVSNCVCTSIDISIPANQAPTLKFVVKGEPAGETIVEAETISFSQDKLKLLPELKPGSVTFVSLVEDGTPFVDENVNVQDLQMPNFAGITATRILTAAKNFYRLAADSVQRKFSITVLDSDNSTTSGAILSYKELINKQVKFRLVVGNQPGFIYEIQFSGLLTNQQPGEVQGVIASRVLEVTVKTAKIILS